MPLALPRLDNFLANLKLPAFSPWIEVLSAEEIEEYQLHNHLKFPLLHLIPTGSSLSELKSNKIKQEMTSFENDCWRFLADIAILTAGSPFSKYIAVDVFRWYTRQMIAIFLPKDKAQMLEYLLGLTGGGSMALFLVFLITLLLLYKCRCMLISGSTNFILEVLLSLLTVSNSERGNALLKI